MFKRILGSFRFARDYYQLPFRAKKELWRDSFDLPESGPDVDTAIKEGIGWLERAQDSSLTHDGGVARHYSLIDGWGSSYPETTGYIIPTILEYAKRYRVESLNIRARKMLDWLVSIQFPEGGFQGGLVDSTPKVPVTFNTGQILLGLAAGTERFGDRYHGPMCLAADWLVNVIDSDGCWRRFQGPYAEPGDKTYDTHIAWGLFEAARIEPNRRYAEAALANINWALKKQTGNGWFEQCCLDESKNPLTHTLGYVLRGLLEAYRFTKDEKILNACILTADGLLSAIDIDGRLPGRLDRNWRGSVNWACLTGIVQIAICWLMLFQFTGEIKYRDAAFNANKYVRRTMRTSGPSEVRGAIKGSFPINGAYCTFEYLNWACKFYIDANLLEKDICGEMNGAK